VSEAALAPTMGPATEEERKEAFRWLLSSTSDRELWVSLEEEEFRSAWTYVLIRARRAGAKLEDLL
jgi:hypothetical protein